MIVLALVILSIAGSCAYLYRTFVAVPPLKLAEAGTRNEHINAIDEWLTSLQAQHKFNGVVLVIKNGESLIEKGYGFTDHSYSTPLTPQSSMRLGSVSKQFTAAAIMALHDEGKVDFDDNVTDYIAQFPYDGVTIRQLLNMTSGIPDNYMKLGETHADEYDYLTLEHAMALITSANAAVSTKPGDSYDYSNTSYVILARLVEIVSGQSFEGYLQSSLFEPLGMTNTRVWNLASADDRFPNQTKGFENFVSDEPEAVEFTVLDGVSGDGAVFSSIEDFKIWNKFWNGNEIIKPQTLSEAFIRPKLNGGALSDYGFGWVITDDSHWHNGSWLAANSMIIRNPQKGDLLVVIDNSTNQRFNGIVKQLKSAMTKL